MNLNLCLRRKAVDVVDDAPPPPVPEDSALRGRAADLHHQLSHMKDPILVPRDQLVINLDFDNIVDDAMDERPSRPSRPSRLSRALQIPGGPYGPHGIAGLACTTTASGAALAEPEEGSAAASSTDAGAGAPVAAASPFASDGTAATAAAATVAASGERGAAAAAGPKPPYWDARSVSGATTGSGTTSTWVEGQAPYTRGFVRVKSVRAPEGLSWTHSRKCLEVLLAAERGNGANGVNGGWGGGEGASCYLSHEQRLRERLERLNLEMVIVAGDGNCQFRSLSNELYGTQDHHAAIRRQAVSHILAQREAFEAFLGEDFDVYVRQMERCGTWGDELTLRAVCDSFGLTVHVVTSDEAHWYLTYEPEERRLDREIFLTYIAPIHYNSIRRRSSLKTMAISVSRSFRRLGSGPLSPAVASPASPAAAAAANGPGCDGPCSPRGVGEGCDGGGRGRCSDGTLRGRHSNGAADEHEDEGGGGGGGGRLVRRRLPRHSEDVAVGGGRREDFSPDGSGIGGDDGGRLRRLFRRLSPPA